MAPTTCAGRERSAPGPRRGACSRVCAWRRTRAPPREATRAKPEARRAVARPLTRVVKPAEPREERREREEAERREAPRPRVAPRPLPTAPAGHAPVIAADGNAAGTIELPA